jgi:Na+:H+ antiporter, NhaA family
MVNHDTNGSALQRFLDSEAAGGLVLMGSAVLALGIANSPLLGAYETALHAPMLGSSLLHWINDGLMAVFFLLVGLEIKRELLLGELSDWRSRALPGFAAAGGMLVPALLYLLINSDSAATQRGWAIPAATDIAFSLGVLALLGSRAPLSLKIFLTALAIIDDLGAVLIIAAFYAHGLSLPLLGAAAVILVLLVALNRAGVKRLLPYLMLGVLLWLALLYSGVHATIAGVALGLAIPLGRGGDAVSPLHRLEHALGPWVGFFVLPVFGFANAGVPLLDVSATAILSPIALGAAAGLFLGKQIGVFGGALIAIRLGVAKRPAGATWAQLYGVSVICGIGFTMSLFIALLAFAGAEQQAAAKLGVLAGSLLSGIAGWLVLRLARHEGQREGTDVVGIG